MVLAASRHKKSCRQVAARLLSILLQRIFPREQDNPRNRYPGWRAAADTGEGVQESMPLHVTTESRSVSQG